MSETQKKHNADWVLFGLYLASLAATAVAYPHLPAEIPARWGLRGEISRTGSRMTIWVMAALPAAILGLLKVVPYIDPRRDSYERHSGAYRITRVSAVLFMIAVHALVLAAGLGVSVSVPLLIKAGVGVLFIIIGNVLTQARPNCTFGTRGLRSSRRARLDARSVSGAFRIARCDRGLRVSRFSTASRRVNGALRRASHYTAQAI